MKGSGEDERRSRGIGERFHEETKYTPDNIGGYGLNWQEIPETYKNYPSPIGTILLPEPQFGPPVNVWEAFGRRRSTRTFAPARTLSLGLLSSLLWSTQGITAEAEGWYFRTAPSAGGLYPVETYILARAVEGLEQGIYHFRPHVFDLEFIKARRSCNTSCRSRPRTGYDPAGSDNVHMDCRRGEEHVEVPAKGLPYIYLDAGHIAQNLYLAGAAAGLGVCAVGAFFDDQVNDLIDVDGVRETTVYLACAGWPGSPEAT